ncbi:MAG: amino acid ABC transporter substrate-binding protein [Woeseia sp.]|nr:amino acid ABC transporter substrate-binding protein [Woeseia sp.]
MYRWLTVVTIAALLGHPSFGNAANHSPTLERIAESGVFRVGFVPDAPPMSFLDADGTPKGYSIALCRHIAVKVRSVLNREDIKVEYVPLITPAERIAAVVNHDVDIECGATTVTLSRREQVDFTLMTYITGGTVLSTKSKPIATLEDLPGKKVAVITGTTTEDALRRFGKLNEFDFTMLKIRTHDDGMRLLDEGKVDGYASDRAMLVGLVFRSADASKYLMVRRIFSREPYSLMLQRGDTEFRLLADTALADLYGDARIRRLYHDWFGRFGEPMSPVVEALYEFQAVSN